VLGAMSVCPARQALARAKAAATRAVEADDTLAEAHNSLAFARMACDWDWTAAEKGFRHALELNPASWITHDWYGQTLHCQGRLDEGLVHIRRAQELEPLSVVLHHHAAWILWLARRYDDVIEECRKALELDPRFYWAHGWTGLAYEQKAMYEESIAALKTACELTGGIPILIGSLAHACAAAGYLDETQKLLDQLEERSQQRYVEPYARALVYAGLGEADHVFEWLDRSSDDASIWLTFLVKCDPRLNPFRSDPRFRNLLRRMGLEG
jgi:adenylate cyclase